MPTVADVIIVSALEGPTGVRRLFGRFLQFRLPAWSYLVALIPCGLGFAAAAICLLRGGGPSRGVSLTLGFWVTLIVTQLLVVPTREELGWRGFVLPRLLATHSPFRAGLLLALVWNFWHLPLWVLSGYSGLDLLLYCTFFSIAIMSLCIYMTWIFCSTGGSLFLAMAILVWAVTWWKRDEHRDYHPFIHRRPFLRVRLQRAEAPGVAWPVEALVLPGRVPLLRRIRA